MISKKNQKEEKIDPRVRDVLILLAAGSFLAASIIFPGLPLALKPFLKKKSHNDFKKWQRFNQWRLKAVLLRMKKQKLVEITETKEGQIVKISEKGKKKVLSYKLEEISLKPKWDGKWRLVIYDIPNSHRRERDFFRLLLKKMKFLNLQKSVYLTPYKCEDEIEFLRHTLGVANHIQILKVARLENDRVYKEYFGL